MNLKKLYIRMPENQYLDKNIFILVYDLLKFMPLDSVFFYNKL